MKLESHLQQGKVRYYLNNNFSLSIVENSHYRWLNFGQTTQSIMLKRKPFVLTLPHQYFMMLPLLFIMPKRVVEFGLGGGNLLRFLSQISPNSVIESIEQSNEVIECFHQYFNPDNHPYLIHQQPAKRWLLNHSTSATNWLIYDIFSSQKNDDEWPLIDSIIRQSNEQSWITLNISNHSNIKINEVLQQLNKIKRTRSLIYFQVPYYKNIIVHLHPSDAHEIENKHIPSRYLNRARKLWLHRSLDR
ncbi:hypothetical protein [Thalassotalea sp. PP2-459]|uniref:hypothetical protein n=1 Tax=Thalassotalea sp. PP2-459 TaxID=1742724 RepID=UPI000944406E|nr:hypothetical protein [Thalassotalea sp. PP2-459]OKY28030.1 hypothetical protein BI291_06230 [Thalassotalea sp. PP2-459]